MKSSPYLLLQSMLLLLVSWKGLAQAFFPGEMLQGLKHQP